MKMSADFKDFLKLLNAKNVEYLVIGGYAVVHYGYVRNTARRPLAHDSVSKLNSDFLPRITDLSR